MGIHRKFSNTQSPLPSGHQTDGQKEEKTVRESGKETAASDGMTGDVNLSRMSSVNTARAPPGTTP